MPDDFSATLERARELSARGDWQQALALFDAADAASALEGADLDLHGVAAYAAGNLGQTFDIWERAYTRALKRNDRPGAAHAAIKVATHLLIDTALMAPIRGWVTRAEELLEGIGELPHHAWIAVLRTYERFLSGDVAAASTWARRAIDLGSRFDLAAAAVGRIADARCHILAGDVARGLEILDAAGIVTQSGELDPIATGIVYCELLCALQGLAQFDRADQWTDVMEHWGRTRAIGSLSGRCRLHRAEVLRLRGACKEAEHEAQRAYEELRPYLRRELGWPLSELGRIRLQLGDVDGAEEAFVAAHQVGWQPEPGLALTLLARGATDEAVVSIRDALERPSLVPSKEYPPNSELRRAPLLAAQIEIEIAAGNMQHARDASKELDVIALRYGSKALSAMSSFTRGLIALADDDATSAREQVAEAVRLWQDIGAPYESAVARSRLAEAYELAGNQERAELERRAARATLESIGVVVADATPVKSPRNPAADPTFRHEGDYWSVGFGGHTARVRDAKGMRYLLRLLVEPDREMHAVDLVISDGGMVTSDACDASGLLDARAKDVYRRRLAEIEDDLEYARARCDLGRIAQAEAERDMLVRELSRAVGLGRDRRTGTAAERARVSVTRAIRQAMARIAQHHRSLADHLERTIRTGAYCVYAPDPAARPRWKFE